MEYEIVDKNYARTFNISDDILEKKAKAVRGHLPFSENEIQILWENVNTKKYNVDECAIKYIVGHATTDLM